MSTSVLSATNQSPLLTTGTKSKSVSVAVGASSNPFQEDEDVAGAVIVRDAVSSQTTTTEGKSKRQSPLLSRIEAEKPTTSHLTFSNPFSDDADTADSTQFNLNNSHIPALLTRTNLLLQEANKGGHAGIVEQSNPFDNEEHGDPEYTVNVGNVDEDQSLINYNKNFNYLLHMGHDRSSVTRVLNTSSSRDTAAAAALLASGNIVMRSIPIIASVGKQ